MKRFRVKGIDIASGEPVEFSEFEAASREDVVARLGKVGVEVRSIDEVAWIDLNPATRLAIPAPTHRTFEGDLHADSAAAAQSEARKNDLRQMEEERAARAAERAAFRAPRQRVLVDLSWGAFFSIMFAVAFGILLSGVLGVAMSGFLIGTLAAIGRAARESESGAGRSFEPAPPPSPTSGVGMISDPSPIEIVLLLSVLVVAAIAIYHMGKSANWFRPRSAKR